jgi:beta-glucanase (GH16 family)
MITTCIIAVAAMMLASAQDAPLISSPDEWKLVWNDEFETDGPPDPDKWDYERGFVRNKEWQWYQPENARCENGLLVIEGRREKVDNPNFESDHEDWKRSRQAAMYTSASVTTRGKHEWQYGRLEVRARIPARSGLWPAIWTLGVNGEWPTNGEVDVMEFYQNTILANVAWGSHKRWVGRWDTVKVPYDEFTMNDPEWGEQFHIWRMDWNADFIRLFLDDRLLNQTDLTITVNADGTNPFHQPHYLILNLAIGSTGGDPTNTELPARYEIDYVRFYDRDKKDER